jgi:hypothetical protein
MHDEFPGDSWIRLFNHYLEVYLFHKSEAFVFVKNNRGTSVNGDIFRMTVRICNSNTSCTDETSDSEFN